MSFPQVPQDLRALVKEKFAAARASGALTYYPTEVTTLIAHNVPFQLRYSQALAHKPAASKGSNKGDRPFDPFEHPPEDLFISCVASSHKLVLNKFAIVPEHFILATKDFKEQTDLLELDDLAASYACIQAYKDGGNELFVFFNSGHHSGASQRHRHLQFIPVESMKAGLDGRIWEPLIDRFSEKASISLPFTVFSKVLPADLTPKALYTLYLDLYQMACNHVSSIEERPIEAGDNSSQISYNIGLTDKVMVLCPRRAEGSKIVSGNETGFVALNGTLLGGTLLVKNEVEWHTLQDDPSQLAQVLKAIGYPHTGVSNERLRQSGLSATA